MDLRITYLCRNLTRNWARTLLTSAAVGLPIVIYVLSMAVVDGIDRFLDNAVQQLRLAVMHKTSIVNRLPEGYRAKMESLDPTKEHLRSVCAIQWVGGRVENSSRPLSSMGVDPDTFPTTFPELGLTPEEIGAWTRERRAIAIGEANANHFGWKVGDRIAFRMSVPPHSMLEFIVVSTLPKANDKLSLWFRRDYLESVFHDARHPEGLVSFFFVKCGSAADVETYRSEIDALFANSTDETKTQDEKSFMNEYITQQFDLPTNLTILAFVTVAVAVMAAANTMTMNFRDRINEFATLKSMGFGNGLIFGLVQSESLLLCAVGGFVGASIPYVLFTHTALKGLTIPVIQSLEIAPEVCIRAFGISLIIGVIAALWPSILAVRMPVVSALRDLG